MSTLAEIEAAAETLPSPQKEELIRFLIAKVRSAGGALSKPTDLRPFEGGLTLPKEPMEYQHRARAEWP